MESTSIEEHFVVLSLLKVCVKSILNVCSEFVYTTEECVINHQAKFES